MKNISKSVRARLYNISKNSEISFQHIIIRYLHERLLYRLSMSSFCNHFFLKGGTLLYAYNNFEEPRYTLDIDFSLQKMKYTIQSISEAMEDICLVRVNDGVMFDANSISVSEIKENNPYGGVRVYLMAKLDTIRQRLQIDIGFGDIVHPEPVKISFPVLLNDQTIPIINAYTVESLIAEKFHAMIDLADLNSRMKDFYDVFKLIEARKYNDLILNEAIKITFKNRNTPYAENHNLFNESFGLDVHRNKQWIAFTRKSELKNTIPFSFVMAEIRRVLFPIWNSLAKQV